MRVLFAGSPEIALPSLRRLAAEHQVVGILTNPPAPKGRGLSPAGTPVAELAAEILPGSPVLAPESLGASTRAAIAALRPELLVVYAYGRIFGPKFLALFPRGGINVHPSLLPRWRGCAPIQHAILSRDAVTGLSVQRIALQMDCGDILASREVPLDGSETAASLTETMAGLGAELLATVLASLEAGTERASAQDGSQASYCGPLEKPQACLDWSLPAVELAARVRAFNPWPVAWTLLRGQRLAIHEAAAFLDEAGGEPALGAAAMAGTILNVDKSRGIMVQTGQGRLALRCVQLPGKKALSHREFANGVRDLAGLCLGA
ncbi:MAG: methionyl-tRNA formyltransferase [Spirochaetes bacterium GWD1_61_31]|nr:MAG: methionyl-tRNA formyltransferase [Spirochaetes bacterium GWB1_60_80]OHD35269.1 MAG: methionyl-tRNA formyltransferase [Spirochaetes bacterium GWC1_61_12]OHD36024.1 MAG: methionyl-tRNA formyltransferase [Spirochaetes bacterium GWD1_61_31]OHD42221.1 MAG: methionyl-tRNA formyltransferase [Spirochaetes bacterium GWE1_60_18]OHD57973.1 MAG: methionyl-tRNA formyltransferase [Spirochaetes bacterium GWF1_60_12]